MKENTQIEEAINDFANKIYPSYPSEEGIHGIKTYRQVPYFVDNLRQTLTTTREQAYKKGWEDKENEPLTKEEYNHLQNTIVEPAKEQTKKEIATRIQILLTDPDEYSRKNIYEYSKTLKDK